ncbi:Uncharacterised protein [Burkholderia pseudomallei]|nr:Uncharacterised protein [Burkholderia pseudomallei]CAJ6617675.1 Uncharacterised protein [Burkholderia pseudomallei]
MSGLSVPLLLILSAIAVACVVVLWRYRLGRTPQEASIEQARQSKGSARTDAANADARAINSVVNATTGGGQPRPTARAAISAPLKHTVARTASVPASPIAIDEPEGEDPGVDTVQGDPIEAAAPATPVSAPFPTSPAVSERINGDISAVARALAEEAIFADRDSERGERAAPQTPAVASLADEPTTTEEASVAVHQAEPDTNVTEGPATAFATKHIEVVAEVTRPEGLQIDRGEQQLDPPVQALETTTPLDKAAEAPLATEEKSPALQPLPDDTNEPERADLTEPRRNTVAVGDELAPSQTEYLGQQLEHSDQTAGELHAAQPDGVPVAPEATASVGHSGPVTDVPDLAATIATAEARAEAPAATLQPASVEATPPIDPSVALAGLDSQPTVPVQSDAAVQAEGELEAVAYAVPSDARVDVPEPVAIGATEAIGQASASPLEATAPSEQQVVLRADESAELVEDDLPARAIGRIVANHECESTTGHPDDLQYGEGDNAAQLQHPAPTADGTTEESPGAALELDALDSLLRDTLTQPARQAVHRDRRGRHTLQPQPSAELKRAKRQSSLRPPAEARIRLTLHPIRRTVGLALILLRPADFPEQVTLELNGSQTIDALEEGQYGDVDLTWDADLLLNEIRVSCAEGYQWVRGARSVHIFAADPTQADLVSVAAAKAGTDHTIICREQDADTVCDIAESAGSARPAALRRSSGIPNGWVVLEGYRPTRAAVVQPAPAFSPLDPGQGIEIALQGGLEVGRSVYAQGRPPCIRIEPMLDGISVRIGGVVAEVSSDGTWKAPGWDAPGQHRIEVVPGPSRNYEIKLDPGTQGGWAFWDAYGRLTAIDEEPWSRAQICGALLAGPSGERVLAAELQPMILALGVDGMVGALRPRAEAGVSVGFATGTPAFLLASSGRKRHQGKIVWLGLPPSSEVATWPSRLSQLWIEAVRSAAARRLAMQADEEGVGQLIWKKVVLVARSAKRQRHG